MVKMNTLRLVLGLVVIKDMELIQMDVKIVFLHWDLDEAAYVKWPKGFVIKIEHPTKVEMVCRLNKAFYVLKKGLRQWYIKFDTYI